MTLDDLKWLLDEQKRITIEKCLSHTAHYNTESTDGHMKSLPIDKEKFTKQGLSAKYPDDYNVLVKYRGG